MLPEASANSFHGNAIGPPILEQESYSPLRCRMQAHDLLE